MSKNIINQEPTSTGGSSSVTYSSDTLTATQEIKFPLNVTEGYNTDFKVRNIPVSPPGTLAGVKFTKQGNVVHMTIPSFYGSLLVGNVTSTIRIVTVADIPARFLPVSDVSWPINAWNTASLINSSQDSADLVVSSNGNVDLISRSFLWNGIAGLLFDVSVSWHV